MSNNRKLINTPNKFLLIAILLFAALTIYLFNNSAVKSFIVDDNKTQFEDLKNEANNLKSHFDSLLIFNTKLGIVKIRKTDTIIILEKKKEILISELEDDKKGNKIKAEDLVKLKKVIEDLRIQELAAYNSFIDELKISGDTSEFSKLSASTKIIEKQIEKTKNDIEKLLHQQLNITILHFRTFDKKEIENYQHEKVKTIILDCYIQGCLLKPEPVFLLLKAPSGKIIPVETKTNLITFSGKKEFPSISDTIKTKGIYSKKIPANLGLPGLYEIILLDNENRTLDSKTIELL